jgi:hypothetical protein
LSGVFRLDRDRRLAGEAGACKAVALVVAGQRIHIGIRHAGWTLDVEEADATWRIHDGDRLLGEVPRTTPKPWPDSRSASPNEPAARPADRAAQRA